MSARRLWGLVLGLFFLVTGLGFGLLADRADPSNEVSSEQPSPRADTEAKKTSPAAVAQAPAAPKEAAKPTREDEEPLVLKAALTPLFAECFRDASPRYSGPRTVSVAFTYSSEAERGRLLDGQLLGAPLQDPYLEACLIDSLGEAQVPPPHGAVSHRVELPFSFVPVADGGD